MNGTAELAFLIAQSMTEEAILDLVTDSIEKHKIDPSSTNKTHIEVSMAMFMTKRRIDEDGMENLRKSFQEFQVSKDMFSEKKKN